MMDCPLVALIRKECILKETGQVIDLEDHQTRILNAMFTPREDGLLKYMTYVYSTPKKEGKTAIGACVAYAFARLYGGDCISIANDKEQARSRMFVRVLETLAEIKKKRPVQYKRILHEDCWEHGFRGGKNESEIVFNQTGQKNPGPHIIRAIPGDYAGEAGAMNAMTVWDELWGYSSTSAERLYNELQPIPAIPYSIRFITTYAGYYGESTLLWNIYDAVVKPDAQTDEPMGQRVEGLEDLPVYEEPLSKTICYWDHENRMPWKTEEFLQAAKNAPDLRGREGECLRLWENRWSSGAEPFLPAELIDSIMDRAEALGLRNNMAA